MKKHRMRAALLAGLILMSLAGCAVNTDTAGGIPDPQLQKIIAADGSSSERMTGSSTEFSTNGTDSVSSVVPESTEPAEKESGAPKSSEFPSTESPVSSAPVKNEISDASTPAPAENHVQTEKPKIEESKPTALPSATPAPSPKPTEPTATPTPTESPTPPAATSPPSEPEPTEPPAPAFDIDYWISYAQSYAESVGLRLESSAVDCWDNPIIAGAHCTYLERDIESRLNRYNRDEDVSDVWIWAEPRADGSYDLYIGYA